MSKKNRDRRGRWRQRTVAFRASDREIEELNEMVFLSGLNKQDYLIKRVLQKDIVIIGNPRVFKRLKDKMDEIYKELIRLNSSEQINESLLETIKLVSTIYIETTKQTKRIGENNNEDK